MKRKTLLLATSALVLSSVAGTPAGVAFAQDDDVEEIVVTGSYIKRKSQINSPSPIEVIGADDISAAGANTIADITQNLTINTGAENNPDAFTQNATTGTTNINLRGLGLASTLVLLNGKRQVTTANASDSGVNFVDTSALVPQIAIDRVEIVKDGAAATYGTDAVAGVVNFITRDKFEGLELNANYQWVEGTGEASDRQLAAIVGHGGESWHIMAAISHVKRTPLTTAERRLSRVEDDSSSLGNPGAFFTQYLPTPDPLNPVNLGAPVPVIDPTGCAEPGGIPTVLAPVGQTGLGYDYNIGFCKFDFGDYYNLVAAEDRTQAFSRATFDLSDTAELFAEVGYSESSLKRNNSPTFPYLKLPIVPGYHPEYPFGSIPGVAFFGRAIGNGGVAATNRFNYDTTRMSVGARFDIGNWSNEFSVTHATNNARVRTPDVIVANFNNALLGFGGANCDAFNVAPGTEGCLFYNPFATSYTTAPNDPSLFDWYMGEQDFQSKSKMTTYDYVISGEVGSTSQGPIGMALGMQVRNESLVADYDDISNADGFGFLVGNSDYAGDRKVLAMFGELAIPITDKLEAQVALRFEDYDQGLGDTMDPKIALIYNASNNLA
ncbi:MAG: TonB-dependent receptor, partial [Sphingomonadales bacterium]|nr:TonB-dependent receptor [Sphingomonadales bacterium]